MIRFRSFVGGTRWSSHGADLVLLLTDVDKSRACDWLLDCDVTVEQVVDWLEDSAGSVGSAAAGGKLSGYP